MRPSLCLAAALVVLAAAPAVRAADKPAAPADAMALDPARERSLYLGVIESLRKEGRARAALANLDAFDKQHPHDPRAEILRADCLADIGQTEKAEALYRGAVKGALADQAEAGLGHVLAARGDWQGAADAFQEAVERRPTETGYLNDLGFALIEDGKTGDGLFRLRQAIELSPDDVLARNNLIVALKAAGRGSDAQAVVDAIKAPAERSAAATLLAAAPAAPAGDGSAGESR